MKYFTILLVLLSLMDCSQPKKESIEPISNSLNTPIILQPALENQNGKEPTSKLPKNFPSDFVVDEYYPSALKGKHVFGTDGVYYFIHGDLAASKKIEIGKWQKNNNYIIFLIDSIVGLRPIGSPTNLEEVLSAANPEAYYEYNDYQKFKEVVSKKDSIKIDDFIHDECSINKAEKAANIIIDTEEFFKIKK